MTRLIGFAGKRNNFRNETFERRCGAIPRKKRPHKTKNVCFPNKNAPFWCHCEAATRPWQSLSRRHGIPWRSTGARNKKKSLSQKTWIRCVVPLPLPLFQGSVSFRPTIVRSGMANRSVKDCRVGRKSCALLAMTNLVGFAGKRSNFRNEMFERRCGAIPRKKRPQKMKNVRFPNKNAPILCHCEERSDAAILKFEAWHPGTKHGNRKRQNPEFLIRR